MLYFVIYNILYIVRIFDYWCIYNINCYSNRTEKK